jgi:hypothetical protein
MTTVQFIPEFILAAVDAELAKAGKASDELMRLMNIGYINSQTGLDVAKEVKTHLMKAYTLLEMVNTPETNATKFTIAETMGRQDTIIRNIEST